MLKKSPIIGGFIATAKGARISECEEWIEYLRDEWRQDDPVDRDSFISFLEVRIAELREES